MPGRDLRKTGEIFEKLALRRIAELPALDVGPSLRSAKGKNESRSSARKKKASPYSRSPGKKRSGPPTTGISSELGTLRLGSGSGRLRPSSKGRFESHAIKHLTEKPTTHAAATAGPSVTGVSTSVFGCGGASGPIIRQLRNEENFRQRNEQSERERRRQERSKESHSTLEASENNATGCGGAGGIDRAQEAFKHNPVSSLVTRSTQSSLAKLPVAYELPALRPRSRQRQPKLKPGYEGLLDSPSPSSPTFVAKYGMGWRGTEKWRKESR